MTKRLISVLAPATCCVPAYTASPFPFAHDDAGRPVREFSAATAARFTPQDRDLMRITMGEERAFTNPSVVEGENLHLASRLPVPWRRNSQQLCVR